ncbi:Uncharacterised protein [Psychrobacter phenylpyruvicus]|uniref:Uncharacterized protein n=1 Tax=Psychrobacter phenylpyruvicus TaxID=29432 RepID=A0A379LM39_9GAMM|nr:Uncharacterised protein [Psychrobacter phenylpyruvicus]
MAPQGKETANYFLIFYTNNNQPYFSINYARTGGFTDINSQFGNDISVLLLIKIPTKFPFSQLAEYYLVKSNRLVTIKAFFSP